MMAKSKKKADTRSIKIAIRFARDRRGWNQSRFARELATASGKEIAPAHVTNWKTRGMPGDHLELVSSILGCSADELLGRAAPVGDSKSNSTEPWPLRFPRQLYDQLDHDERVIFAYESRKTIAEIISQRVVAGKLDTDH
jgi:hypothetical protein